MAVADISSQVLEHIKKTGSTNTYRLARELDVDREQLLGTIKQLEGREQVEVRHGVVQLLASSVGQGFVVASSSLGTVLDEDLSEKKPAGVTAAVEPPVSELLSEPQLVSVPKKNLEKTHFHRKNTRLLTAFQKENEVLKEKLAGLQSQVKKLQQQVALPSKVITRTIVKKARLPPAPAPQKLLARSKKSPNPPFHLLKNLRELKIPAFAKK